MIANPLWFSLRIVVLGCCLATSLHAAQPTTDTLALDHATRQKCLTVLRNGLRSAEFWPSIHAAEGLTLGGYGKEVIAFLEPLLDGPYDDQQRCGLSRELVRAGQRGAAKILLKILAGDKPFGHTHAAESLYKVGELGDGSAMRRAFEQTENPRLRLMAAAALGKAGHVKAVTHIREMVMDQDAELSRTAAWVLARIGHPNDVKLLKRRLANVNDEISQAYFVHALATLGDAEGLKALARNLDSNNPAIRTYAATFAGDARAVSVGARLIELLEDENLDVRVRSAQSLLVLAQPEPKLDRLSVLPDARDAVYQSLVKQAQTAAVKRRAQFEKLETPEQCQAWQKSRREFFLKQLGGLPEKTPLNAEVVGKLDGGNYRIEKVIYQSRPHHHVTATLFLPKTKAPYPAVIIACGHTKSGKAAGYNQKIGILLAQHGMAAMCYDPIGQGERSQSLTETGHPEHKNSTAEHFLTGVGAILTGTNTAGYRLWDGIRGIDYLCQRKDINPQKIGCTGCSGGGTMTSYLMALDERVSCAAPACYVTTFEQLIKTIGPQDAEQNIHAQIAFGMEHTDYVLMRAPKPTLICSTTKDYFSIEGAWDTFRQAKRFYGYLGQPEKVNLVETPGGHGVTKTGREAIVRWMQRWLLEVDRDVIDSESKTWSEKELQCTPKGQVLLLPGEVSVYQLNAQRSQMFKKHREAFSKLQPQAARETIRAVAGIRELDQLPAAGVRSLGSTMVGDHHVRKLVLETPGQAAVPVLRFLPNKPNGTQVLYLPSQGKTAVAKSDELNGLLNNGQEVWVLDLPGIGELQNRSSSQQLGDWKTFFLAYLLDQSLVGLRTEAVLNCARWMDFPPLLVAEGDTAISALHAKALEPKLFKGLELVGSVESWSKVCEDSHPAGQLPNTIHDVLEHYDLPDLKHLAH